MNMEQTLPVTRRREVMNFFLFMPLIVFLAFVFALLSVSESPLVIGLGVGLVGGVMLLAKPRVTVEIVLVAGLLMGALISFADSVFDKLTWVISLLGMSLLLPAMLSMIGNKKKFVPGFVWFALAFMAYSLVTTILHWNSLAESVSGFKHYFQAIGLLMALAYLPFTRQHMQHWQKMLLGIALLQLPFALYEFLVLVPQRGGLSESSATTDVVAGTFGANLIGGSPGMVMVGFLLIVFSFLFSRWRSGFIPPWKVFLLSIFVLLPVAMGENKVVVLMLPLLWFVLVRHDFVRSPLKYIPVVLSGILTTALLGYVYVFLIMRSTISEAISTTIDYNFGSGGYGEYFLNRTTVMTFWFKQQGLSDPVGFFFGNGLGSAFLGSVSGHIGMRYPGYGIDLTAASTLLWDLGIFGLALFVAIFVGAWRTAEKIYRESNDAEVKSDCIAIQGAIALFLVFTFYSQDIVNLISMEIFYSAVLGYLAFLYSEHNKTKVLAI